MGAITPFIVLLIVGLIFNYIPMDGGLKRIGNIIIGIIAIVMLLRFFGILSICGKEARWLRPPGFFRCYVTDTS
ncbi:MAG TPA: hypothetical protein PKV72_02635 [Candidatus Peribacteria bacterium]|nr:hypothetical protein [Candidatus Peribacteria bacterium]